MPLKIAEQNGGILIHLKVVPGASRSKIVGLLGDALKIAVSKPPSGGAANKEVIQVLADALKISAKQINLVAGQTNPRKQVLIMGLATQLLLDRLAELGIAP